MIISVPYTVLRESPVARRSGFFGGCCRYGLDWGDTGAGKGAHVAGTGGTRMASAQAPVRVPRSSGLPGHALLAPGHHCDPWHLPYSCTAACRGRKPTCWWLADRCWVPDTLLHLGGRPNVLLVGVFACVHRRLRFEYRHPRPTSPTSSSRSSAQILRLVMSAKSVPNT